MDNLLVYICLAGDAGLEPTKRESNSRGLPISLIPNIERLYTSLAKVSSLMRLTKVKSHTSIWSALRNEALVGLLGLEPRTTRL